MKEFVLRTITFIAAMTITSQIVSGFEIDNIVAYLSLGALFSLIHLSSKTVIVFFTLPHNNFNVFIFHFLFISLILYFVQLTMPGILISDGKIGPYITSFISIPTIEMKSYIVILFASFIISLMNLCVSWTISKN